MADIMLNAQMRTVIGKQVRSLRRQGLVPANVYGRGIESIALQFDVRDLRDVLMKAGTTTVVDLRIRTAEGSGDGGSHPVLIETIQRDAAKGNILHIDFRQVDLNRPVRASVPIELVGNAPAVLQGAVLVQALDTLEVEALPGNLPHVLEIDISGMVDTTSQIAIRDVQLPQGVTAHADPEVVIVSVVASRLEQDVAAEDAVTAVAAAEATAAAEESGAEEQPAAGSEA